MATCAVETKTCRRCGATKPVGDFRPYYLHHREYPLRKSWCRACERSYQQSVRDRRKKEN